MKKLFFSAFLIALGIMPVVVEAGELVRLIACPVYRDTRDGRKSGCWLADDRESGIRYDVTPSPIKPDWNFEVLVEGYVSDKQDNLCGGVVLEPVRVSRLATHCTRHMLPAEGYPGRRYSLPSRNVRPLSEERPTPPGPYTDRTFHMFFELNRHFVSYQYGDYLLDTAITWIRAAKPKKLIVTGYAVTEPETLSGRTFAEKPELARQRAEKMREALIRLGVAEDKIEIHWSQNPDPVDVEAADGLAEASRRRVDIRALF
ncbi:hypothetical protein [Emcibacter sp.]|uniref:hypothetical protein n=1 Tax=Emcibacter sp. TaxID=1979954 RepID=UPI003A8D170D